ncbi:metallophosphoesterase [Ovoidimarina sediminis]|uniref:metallophosphoesterase n=1 Tax=Ovoidimarina sediminis TaxID=3079856 RepID=UPI002906F375|nr:metallophosphoesterase [Rhodophyticola sp. MJ-SS7]MDU8945624.1 metallophosphoesterase [Rhodophyticola sp. MJ-SS7]
MAQFLHLTDLHVVAPGKLASGVLDTRSQLCEAIDRLTELRGPLGSLKAALVTGDISDDGSPESYKFARSELERLELPLLVIPGNHDDREAMRAAFADLPVMPKSGLIDWFVDIGEACVVGLDTLVEGQGGGRLRPESLALLRQSLSAAEDRPVIIAMHHPPLCTGIRFMDAIGLENLSDLRSLMAEAQGDITIVSGHVHGVYRGRVGGHTVLTAPATCSAFALDRRIDAPVGFYSGPTGFAVIDTGPEGVWSVLPLSSADGPYPF